MIAEGKPVPAAIVKRRGGVTVVQWFCMRCSAVIVRPLADNGKLWLCAACDDGRDA